MGAVDLMADPVMREVVAGIAAGPLDSGKPAQKWFRVEAHWPGGGWAWTKPFPDKEAALAWAIDRCSEHPDADIKVEPRPAPPLSECGGCYVDPKIAAGDRRALHDQVRHPWSRA